MEPSTHNAPIRDRLLALAHRLEHILPGQGPIRDFVHHNTLHGFEHLPFPEALRQARQLTGIFGFLPIEQFRILFRQGRITTADLETELRQAPQLAADEEIIPTAQGPIRRLDVYRTALLHDLRPLQPSQLRWQIEEMQALTHFTAELTPENRQQLTTHGSKPEAQAVAELWQACQTHLHPPPEQPTTTGHLKEGEERVLEALWPKIGTEMTLRALLLALTGIDILEEARPHLLRHLSAYLDHGLAGWHLPGRELGFFAAWRQSALADWSFLPEELPDWREEIASLGDDPLECLIALLTRMGLAEAQWPSYLERLALELPGWSGMVMWRFHHPGYQGLPKIEWLDYLALRLMLERLYAMRLCRNAWQVEPRLDTLRWHFRHNPAEFLVRWHLFNLHPPEHLATRAQRLLQRSAEEPPEEQQWRSLARMMLLAHDQTARAGQRTTHGQGWPLFQLCQHLGIDGPTLERFSPEQVKELFVCLERLEPEQAGYLWLQAYEGHYRQHIFNAIHHNRGRGAWAVRQRPPAFQLVFCMDDREEGIRRHLEELVPDGETLGAAGFFGLPIHWQGIDDRHSSALCPIVVTPAHIVREIPRPEAAADYARHLQQRGWRLKISEKLFQGSRRGILTPALLSLLTAPAALALLVAQLLAPRTVGSRLERLRQRLDHPVTTDLALTAPANAPAATPHTPRPGFTDTEQAERVGGFLRTLGLTYGFAPLVVLLGHGSSSRNNPHLAAYDCGACSGRHGGPNARLFAAMANRPEVRALLRLQGIDLPDATWFLGAEHNSCDEGILWFDLDRLPTARQDDFARLKEQLDEARAASAHERCRRLASAPRYPDRLQALAHMEGRANDLSQARPELGHATNAVALIGRRSVSRGAFFDRRMFLISYDPTQDPEGRIAENILLAAGPVGAGISLEYYFSTVNNDRFGCGSKITHNVTGLMAVMEGASSDLRTGLPQQMIEIHEAMRLLVIVEQMPEILGQIHGRQPVIRQLVDNGWIILAAREPESGALHLFRPGLGWEPWSGFMAPPPTVACSSDWYSGHDGPLPPALIALPGEKP